MERVSNKSEQNLLIIGQILYTLIVYKMSILKTRKKANIVQFICFAIAIKTRTLGDLFTNSSKKQHCEYRSIPTC